VLFQKDELIYFESDLVRMSNDEENSITFLWAYSRRNLFIIGINKVLKTLSI